MKNNLAGNILRALVIISVFILPVSATSVLDISVIESINAQDTFNGTLTNDLTNGIGQINITNPLGTDLFDITIDFNNGTTDSGTWATTSPGVNLTMSGSNVNVHINYLYAGSSALINYTLSSASKPILFTESYDSNKILINDSTNASLTLTSTISADIINIVYVKTAANINGNGISDFNFSNNVTDLGTSSITSNTVITWNIPELNTTNNSATLDFTITEADSTAHNNSSSAPNQSAIEFYVGNGSLSFTISNSTVSVSGVTLNGAPTATTLNFQIFLQKRQLDSSNNGTDGDDWGFTPTIINTDSADSINYTINTVTMYVTNSTNLSVAKYSQPPLGPYVITQSGTWTDTEWKIYNFSDPISPVPVGWIDVNLSVNLTSAGSQLIQSYATTNGTYILVQKIYVINGYLIEVRKTIAKNASADYYDITLWVHNKGNLKTPPTVIVYDIIPQNFSMVYMSTSDDGNASVNSPLIGQAYWWNVSTLEADGTPGDQKYINYTVNGTGIYHMIDLFIVGIDPTYSLTMQTTPVLSISNIMIMDANFESLLSFMTIGMIIVGLVGRRKYNKER